jgi:hypothetical protein
MIKYFCDACGHEMAYQGTDMESYLTWGRDKRACGNCTRDLSKDSMEWFEKWLEMKKENTKPEILEIGAESKEYLRSALASRRN